MLFFNVTFYFHIYRVYLEHQNVDVKNLIFFDQFRLFAQNLQLSA